ncbi:MAG: hypothetical protein ACI4D7_04685 [Lachnospiraceae bacterium]
MVKRAEEGTEISKRKKSQRVDWIKKLKKGQKKPKEKEVGEQIG